MMIFLVFILIVAVLMLVFWTFQFLVGLTPEELERELGETVASERVEQMLEQLDSDQFGPISRQKVWQGMSWIWKETRLFALGSGSILASLYLLIFAALWGLVWLKTLLRPNEEDLRLLLGGELFMLVQVRRRNDD